MKFIAALAAVSGAPNVYANSNSGGKFYFSPTPRPNELDEAAFLAITDWVPVTSMGNHGESGADTNMIDYDTWDTDVIQKAKGMTDAGSPEIEFARVGNDPGQMALRAAALTKHNYATKVVRDDALTSGGVGTQHFNRGLVAGPRRPMGRNEDFDLEVFTFGYNQREVVVEAT